MDTYSSTPYQTERMKQDDLQADFLFVGGLPAGISQTEIRNYFRRFGVVDMVVLPKNRKGKVKGFAYVYFHNKQDAISAVLAFGEHILNGKAVVVQKGITPTVAAAITREMQFRKIFITNLPRETSVIEVEQCFSTYGPVSKVLIPKDGISGRGFCYLVFEDTETYNYMISLKKVPFKGIWLTIDPAVSVNLLHSSEFSHLEKKLNPDLDSEVQQAGDFLRQSSQNSHDHQKSTNGSTSSKRKVQKIDEVYWKIIPAHLNETLENYRFNVRAH
jgi:RNA recognition motif-containing protein